MVNFVICILPLKSREKGVEHKENKEEIQSRPQIEIGALDKVGLNS